MNYRQLTSDEVRYLEKNGNISKNWNDIKVSEEFNPANLRNNNFAGQIFIGKNVSICNVRNLYNYIIEDNVIIDDIASLSVEEETSFGNGLKISVLNEGGGRDLIICDRLSSQLAYLLVTYRQDENFVDNLEKLIIAYADTKKSSLGKICKNASLKHSGIIKNVWIGESAEIEGVNYLENGTLSSSIADPIKLGSGIICKHFIIQSGSVITDGAVIENCFIGQGVRIGKQYSAENSAFFSNCEGYHGEAVSVFAGPYTVSHHKSSLLIAAMFSFYNAGSGSNQSNHMYKLGPIHQGVLERGSKTGSFSYMLWPSRIGAFSVAIGKHYSNFDAGEFPFSYINEQNGKSVLTPALNLFTVGTRRDSEKWPVRDRRKDPLKYDVINFQFLNPYTIGKVIKGSERLRNLLESANKDQEYISYKGLHIKRLLLKTCAKYYDMIVKIYIGQEVVDKIIKEDRELIVNKIPEIFEYDRKSYSENWIDAGGMFFSEHDYIRLISAVADGGINDLDSFFNMVNDINQNYIRASWAWCAKLIEKRFLISINELSKEIIIQIVSEWKENSVKLNNMILKDAEKEFDQDSKISYGIDGDENAVNKDFLKVRGEYSANKFVSGILSESAIISKKAQQVIDLVNK